MENINLNDSFEQAIKIISKPLKECLDKLNSKIKQDTYEIRLRSNRPVMLYGKYSSVFLTKDSCTSTSLDENVMICSVTQLTDTFNRLCCYSIHTHQNSLNNGYITMQGGHRAGVIGTAICSSDYSITNIKDISSINIRIARQSIGCADEIVDKIFINGLSSLLIAGAPSSGKTTILRDLIRQLSSGKFRYKTCVIDEREEIAAVSAGIPQNDIGNNTDVFDSYPKHIAITSAIKTMSPQLIVCDEIATDQEINAIEMGVNTGVRFIASIHASSFKELINRPQIRKLLSTYSFDNVVLLNSKDKPCTIEGIYTAEELRNEIYRSDVLVDYSDINWNHELI